MVPQDERSSTGGSPKLRDRIPPWSSARRSLFSALGGLFLLMVAAVAGIIMEARRVGVAQRQVAERSTKDARSFATWSVMRSSESRTYELFSRLFHNVNTGPARSDEPLFPLSALLAPADSLVRDSLLPSLAQATFFRVDLRTQYVETQELGAGAGRRTALPAWVLDSTRALGGRYGRPFIMTTVGEDSVLTTLVMSARRKSDDSAIAAYGFVSDGRRLLDDLMAFLNNGRGNLLPDEMSRGLRNDSLVAVSLRDLSGREVWHTRNWVTGLETDSAAYFPRLAALMFYVAMPQGTVLQLGQAPNGSRLTFLVVLLGVVIVLALLIARQMRREHELARVRSEFTAGVSHELRTPLAQIMLYGETLQLGRTRSDRERQTAAEVIVVEARRLMHLVDNALHFASSSRDTLALVRSRIDISKVAAETLLAFAPLAQSAGIEFETDLPSELWAVGEAAIVRQILLNLLDNALKYGPRGQVVRVGCVRQGREIWLSVADEGPGVTESVRHRIWEPFVRVQVSGGARAGTGIGLAVVRDLTRRLGGRAWVEDGRFGRGACFIIALEASDVADPSLAQPRSAVAAAVNGPSQRVADVE